MHLNWLPKIELRGPGPQIVIIIVSYCYTRVLLYTKIVKETETEETIDFFNSIQLGGGLNCGLSLWLRLCVNDS